MGSVWDFIKGVVKLIRVPNCTVAGVAVIFSAYISLHYNVDIIAFVNGFLTGFFITGAAMVVNDIFDIEVDAVNAPDRPLVSGVVSVRAAYILSVFLIVLGLAFSVLEGVFAFVIAVVFALIAMIYNGKLKVYGVYGNILVALCVVAPFLYGMAIAESIDLVVVAFSIMAFLVNVAREIIKDTMDIKGDLRRGVKTLPMKIGVKKSAYTAFILTFIAVVMSLVIYPILELSVLYLGFVIPSIAIFMYAVSVYALNPNLENARKCKRMYLVAMMIALIALLLSRV
ncbi:hypothetical protein DRO02_00600 [archaeon]|nr:MAG: hypothetical protein DRO21_01910 [archaeon]RLG66166.1 MAG: hypothetical protein DRO02_00600 [archaeon]HDM23939.1 hypothetical protein [Candidatus Bathyarchaeota archaeon]